MNFIYQGISAFKIVILSALALGLASGPVQAQETITLQQATEIALQNNLQIKQAQIFEALSAENLSQSRYSLLY